MAALSRRPRRAVPAPKSQPHSLRGFSFPHPTPFPQGIRPPAPRLRPPTAAAAIPGARRGFFPSQRLSEHHPLPPGSLGAGVTAAAGSAARARTPLVILMERHKRRVKPRSPVPFKTCFKAWFSPLGKEDP